MNFLYFEPEKEINYYAPLPYRIYNPHSRAVCKSPIRMPGGADWASRHALQPFSLFPLRPGYLIMCKHLLLPPLDFLLAHRACSVEDNVRRCEFIYHNLGDIPRTVTWIHT